MNIVKLHAGPVRSSKGRSLDTQDKFPDVLTCTRKRLADSRILEELREKFIAAMYSRDKKA
jgi:hypothetical protein